MSRGYMLPAQSQEWRTPPDLFRTLTDEFGAFTLDPAATAENALAPHFYTIADDGLHQAWFGRVFCNPPYPPRRWVVKAHDEHGLRHTELIVMLLPARTDTTWFHEYLYHQVELRFLMGRLKFSGKGSATFPSLLAIWRQKERAAP